VTISGWLNFGHPATPGKGPVAGRKFLAPPYYSQLAVFTSPLCAYSLQILLRQKFRRKYPVLLFAVIFWLLFFPLSVWWTEHEGQPPQTPRALAFVSQKFDQAGGVVNPVKIFLASCLISTQNLVAVTFRVGGTYEVQQCGRRYGRTPLIWGWLIVKYAPSPHVLPYKMWSF